MPAHAPSPQTTASVLSPQVQRLVRARLLKPDLLKPGEIRRLNRLTAAEVSALISTNRKLGKADARRLKMIGFIIF